MTASASTGAKSAQTDPTLITWIAGRAFQDLKLLVYSEAVTSSFSQFLTSYQLCGLSHPQFFLFPALLGNKPFGSPVDFPGYGLYIRIIGHINPGIHVGVWETQMNVLPEQ